MTDPNPSQNEVFRLLGAYPQLPDAKPYRIDTAISAEEQLSVLEKNIHARGIYESAEYWKDYTDRYLGCSLKMTASGMDRRQVKTILESAVLSGDRAKAREQLQFNERILSLLFGNQSLPEEFPVKESSGQDRGELVIDGDFSSTLRDKGRPIIITGRVLPGGSIETDNSVTVRKGITGGKISAGTGISAPFAELSTLVCEDDILITSYLLNCTVTCAGGLYCSTGSFINKGTYRAYYTIQADVIGHPFGSDTKLELIKADPLLNKTFDPQKSGDAYFFKVVAMNKIHKGTRFSLYDTRYNVSDDLEGAREIRSEKFMLKISRIGE